MGAIVVLVPANVSVEPGGEVSLEVRIENDGRVVDLFSVSVLGDAGPWARVEPPTISLFPDASGVVMLTFAPPRSSEAFSGEVPFGVKVASKEDPEGSSVEEGVLQVGSYSDTFAELIPRTARGRATVAYSLAVDNRGNAPINATLEGTDPNDLLDIELAPPGLVADPNTAAFAKVKVKPRERFWTGPPKSHQFQVAVQGAGPVPLTADGTLLQEAVIPKWLPKALMALAAMLVAAVLFWLMMLKPAIRSEAAEITDEKLEPVNAAAAAQEKNQQATAQALEQLTGGAFVAPTFQPVAAPVPWDLRLPSEPFSIEPGEDGSDAYEVPDGRKLLITDVILGNPGGDSGTVFIQRNNNTMLELRLDNFRDLDFHFASPIILEAGQRVALRVSCENEANPPALPTAKNCSPAAYFVGELQ